MFISRYIGHGIKLVRPLSTVDNTRDYARVSHSRQWSNCNIPNAPWFSSETLTLHKSLTHSITHSLAYLQWNAGNGTHWLSLVCPTPPLHHQITHTIIHDITQYLIPRDATQSAVMPQYVLRRQPVCPSVTFRYRDHIGWNSSKIVSRSKSLRLLLGLTPTRAIWWNGNTPKIRVE